MSANPLAPLLDAVRPRPVDVPAFRFGTVTGLSPVRVRLDGDTAPVASSPVLLAPVATGDRVQVMIYRRQMTVTGVVNSGRVVTVQIDPAFTVSGWRVVAHGSLVTVFGEFTKKAGTIASGDVLARITTLAPSGVRTHTGQGVNSVTAKVVAQDGEIRVASTPTGDTSYIRVDGLTWPID